jgi:organic radical activating enzyme
METTYNVVEVFRTIQGEGTHAGRAAVFIRFAGCNLWSGLAKHRERDAKRSGAQCPKFCDTDFRPRHKYTISEIVTEVLHYALPCTSKPICVITGGEPMLQLDQALIDALAPLVDLIAVETNGTVALPAGVRRDSVWITLSPKLEAGALRLTDCDELKVVWPQYNPESFEGVVSVPPGRKFVQPCAATDVVTIGSSALKPAVMLAAAEWVIRNPRWRLSVQTHKVIGVE